MVKDKIKELIKGKNACVGVIGLLFVFALIPETRGARLISALGH